MYWPRTYGKVPSYVMRGYRGFDEGFYDGGGCGPDGNCASGGFGFGGIGSFIVGGLAGAFLANAFNNKQVQAAPPVSPQPVIAQPVFQPIPVNQPLPYGYPSYENMPSMAQIQNQQGQKQIIYSNEIDEDEALYPTFDEWSGKKPIKETHSVYTIPSQNTYLQPNTYQIPPMNPTYLNGIPAYQMVPQGIASYPLQSVNRPITTVMPYYMFPVQR